MAEEQIKSIFEELKKIAETQSNVVQVPLAQILGIINLMELQKENMEDVLYWFKELKTCSDEMDEIVKKPSLKRKSLKTTKTKHERTPAIDHHLPRMRSTKKRNHADSACQFFYKCVNFRVDLRPRAGECCVFCSYSSSNCPLVQRNAGCAKRSVFHAKARHTARPCWFDDHRHN